MNNDDEKIIKFISSFRSIKKEIVNSDLSIQLSADVDNWDELSKNLEEEILKLELAGKDVKKLKSSLKNLQKSASDLNGITEKAAKSLAKAFTFVPKIGSSPIEDSFKNGVEILRSMEPMLFELAAVSPARVPDVETKLQSVETMKAVLGRLGISGETDIPDVGTLDKELVSQFIKEFDDFKNQSISEIIKANRIVLDAREELSSGSLIPKSTMEAAKAVPDFWKSLGGIGSSGRGLAESVGSIFNAASRASFALALWAERDRQSSSSDSVDTKASKSLVLKMLRRVKYIRDLVDGNFDKIDKSLKSVAKSAGFIVMLLELFLKATTYVNKGKREVLELFGAHDLTYGVDGDDDDLIMRLSNLNLSLSGADLNYQTSRDERIAAVKAFLKGGGSLKTFDLAHIDSSFGTFSDVAQRSMSGVIDFASEYQNLTGLSREQLMETIAKLTTDSRVSVGQLEEVLYDIAIKSDSSSVKSEDSLKTVIDISDRFDSIIKTFSIIRPMVTRIANQTGLNEKQAGLIVSDTLDSVKKLNYTDMGSLIALAGYRTDSKESIKSLKDKVIDRIRKIRDANQKLLDTMSSNPLANKADIDNLVKQISASRYFESQIANNPDIYASLSELINVLPQAALPVFLEAIDGQLKIIYGKNYERIKETAVGYRSALKLLSGVFPIPDSLIDGIIAAGYDPKTGKPKSGGLDLNSLQPLANLTSQNRKDMEELARQAAQALESANKAIEAAKNGIVSKFGGVFQKLIQAGSWFWNSASSIAKKIIGVVLPKSTETSQPIIPVPPPIAAEVKNVLAGVDYVPIRSRPNEHLIGGASFSILVAPDTTATITSSFGGRIHPVLGKYRKHEGWDIVLRNRQRGTKASVLSQFGAGTIVSAERNVSGFGTLVKVELDRRIDGKRVFVLYGHMSELYVKTGQRIERGALLGIQGKEGHSSGEHLHLEVRIEDPSQPKGSRAINPLEYWNRLSNDQPDSINQ
ncbi:M23 family metallopeptidase, partial [bacterium]|nr:M23 family metallopeptidase [bacterium]